MVDYIKIIAVIINIAILGVLIYAFFYVIPDYKIKLENCTKKILCEDGSLPAQYCNRTNINNINLTEFINKYP